VLKSTSPGVPDFYQGSELWDLSLVDPDNRRPVDFASREKMVKQPLGSLNWTQLLSDWRTGEIKLQVTRALLHIRRENAGVFQSGDYQPLETSGRFAESVVAFARSDGASTLVVIVPRLTSRLGCPPLGLVWDNTTVKIPESGSGWKDGLTGRDVDAAEDVRIAELFMELPFAVLIQQSRGVE
jgi:(1->4)-alpha-D-glucan 1-alpha-D-glucosylmutase